MTATITTPTEVAIDPVGLLPIVANLLPHEVIDLRRARFARRWVAIGLVAVVLMVAGWDIHARQASSSAKSALSDLQDKTSQLQRQTAQFAPLQRIQAQASGLNSTLKGLSTDNLPWFTLLPGVNSVAHRFRNASFETITGQLKISGSEGSTAVLPGSSTDEIVGSLTLTGKAPDKATIAAIVDGLAGVHGVADAYLTAANQVSGGAFQFTISAEITSAALGGQFGSLSAAKAGATS